MNFKQVKLKHLWRELLVLFLCLFMGMNNVKATVHFDAYGMYMVHQPTVSEPYIIVDVLYFDAYDYDSYFTHSAAYGSAPGPAVWVDGNYICSPDDELAWDTHQKSANNWRDNNSWVGKTYNTDYATIRFYDPRHEASSGPAEDRYRVYMYIYLKAWECNKSHTIRIKGYWKANGDKFEGWEEKTLTTNAFTNAWSAPTTAKMDTYNTIKVEGTLSKSYPSTKVGILTDYETKPSSYMGSAQANKFTVNTAEVPSSSTADYTYSYTVNAGTLCNSSYSVPKDVYVQYSYDISAVANNFGYNSTTYGKMYMYKWQSKSVNGFIKPIGVTCKTTDKWNRKVEISWNVYEGSTRSNNGTWSIKNMTTEEVLKSNIPASEKKYTVTLPDYEENEIKVFFVPKNIPNSEFRDELSATNKKAKVEHSWSYGAINTSDENGKIKLSWNFTPFGNASNSKKYSFEIWRSTDNKSFTKMDINGSGLEVTNPETKTLSFVDQSVSAKTTYYYKLKTEVFGEQVWSDAIPCKSGGSKVKSFTATRGKYSGMVKLQWNITLVGSSANFIIQRRPLGSKDEDNEWTDIYTTSGTTSSYSYDDVTALPGSYNEYKLIIWSEEMDTVTHKYVRSDDDYRTTDGFSVSTGIISGNVAYGTGTAVEGVKVTLKQQSADGNVVSGMHSLRLSEYGSGLKYATEPDLLKSMVNNDFSVQMYINPTASAMNDSINSTTYDLFYVSEDSLNIRLKYVSGGYQLCGKIGGKVISSNLMIPSTGWSHLSLAYSKSAGTLTSYLIGADGEMHSEVVANDVPLVYKEATPTLFVICNNDSLSSSNCFNGYIDEFRFWNKALTELEIQRNYCHLMAGSEDGLAIYYPFDEGIRNQTRAYDFSKKNGISNGRHAMMDVPATSDDKILPAESQLSLMSYTDVNGYYEIRGVPFNGDGTSYSVVPTMGIHEFSPAQKSRYVSLSTLNHSGVDFEDISSFPVSGTIYYSGTDYPVEGVNFYVDGNICAKDGEIISTDADGNYTISVPIGDHFISVRKNGHEFENGGRYPADPNGVGIKYTFDKEIKNLEFLDATLVNFTGRVVGGDIESNNAVGFGLSKNNIGVTEFVLIPNNVTPRLNVVKQVSGTTVDYLTNENTVPIPSATENIASTAWRGAGNTDCNKLFVQTDRATGEFSVMVPPLQYTLGTMKVVNGSELAGSSTSVDLSNPLLEYSDTLHYGDGSYELYTYNTKLNYAYHTTTPTFVVKQEDAVHGEGDSNDGAFGIKSYSITDAIGKLTINDIYSIENNQPVYKYGGAIFEMSENYTFSIEAYEEYENADNHQIDRVPLSDVVVTIDNALSDQQPIYISDFEVNGENVAAGQVEELQSNQLKLDKEGKAVYTWTAGLPNITSPYTRTINISYEIANRIYQWIPTGLTGVVLGSLPTGNDFVTSGPDVVDMILRDPPGSNSSAQWASGTVTNLTNTVTASFANTTGLSTLTKLGVTAVTCSGVGVAVINSMESENDMTIGAKVSIHNEGSHTWTRSVEAIETISTSESPDFVGADGDVFIGSATNIIFGEARNVDFHRIGNTNTVGLDLKNIVTTGLQFGTLFRYTQRYIENELLPDLERVRNSLFTLVTEDQMAHPENYFDMTGKTAPMYLTTILPTDPRYGSNNNDKDAWGDDATPSVNYEGPSYKMLSPIDDKGKVKACEDKIVWYNNQIESWKSYLKLNEKQKVAAYEDDKHPTNYSFDAGAKITKSVETTDVNGGKFSLHGEISTNFGMTFGAEFDDCGIIFDATSETTVGLTEEFEGSTGSKTIFSYTLSDEDSEDALTVDVYDYGSFSPIFRTRAGQTSNPYEGKVVTKYYDPGTTIMEATMQIEVPQIGVNVSTVSDVPTGSAANYLLTLGNASEVNKDVTYKLFVLDGTNSNGAQISVDGQVLTEGRLINVMGGQSLIKSMQIRQTNQSILHYENIGIAFASTSQPSDIVAVVYVSAHFTPSASPVSLDLSKTLMNTSTGTDLVLSFKDFDRNYSGQKAFRLQYKRQGATDWTLLQEYVLDSSNKTDNNLMLPVQGAQVDFTLPMASFSDGEYIFRVASASTYGLEEKLRYSEEITLVKDMQRPTPLGQPEPTDGILDIGDDLSVSFNEVILKGELTKTANFKITGVLNGAEVAHETALSMQKTGVSASTEANINLAGKDFSFDMWVNLTGGAGTLLSHGSGTSRFTVGTDANNKLVVNIGGNIYTSANAIPTGKWAFLTLSYKSTVDGGVLYASVADDANTTNLFVNQNVAKYAGNGPVKVGMGIEGAIHELLLWDEAHDMTTALLNRSFTKKPSTRHLIGYWKMNEGDGKSIRDYSRNRHMIMSDATWYMNNENKSVTLDGSSYISIDASKLPVCVDDDYALEFWMRGGSQSDAQLVQMGDIALWVKADGSLQLTGREANNSSTTYTLATSAIGLTDNAWHHIALNVLRQGAAAVYVDGVRCLTTSSSNVGSINTNNLIVGARRLGLDGYDRPFQGQIDEIRVWNATMNGDRLVMNRKVRLTGSEDGLIAYYPFENKGLDTGNQVYTFGYATDLCDTTCIAALYGLNSTTPSDLVYSDNAPAMRTKQTETNVSFTFVASNEKIVINIDEDPAIIEGCTLNFTVRDVRDENGNYSVPAVWSAFVNRNELAWDEEELSIKQEVKGENSVTASIINKSGTQQMWTLSGMPSWLTASSEYGTTNPLAQSKVTFTVSPATPIGKYQETIYLKSNNGIETPLTLNVTVTGQVPEWSINSKDYEMSMNVIGRVMVQGVPMDDTDDIVAAFIGEECRGIAHPVYSSRYDSYYVTMNIYGNTSQTNNDTNKPVTFRAYDASTGTLYPEVLADTDVKFEVQALDGSYANPVVLTASNKIEQLTELKKGWSWLSFYVQTGTSTPQEILSSIADDIEVIKSQNDWIMNENGNWNGNLTTLDNAQMYSVKMKSDAKLRIVGAAVDPSTVITVNKGWNWVSYYGRQVATLADALADFGPQNGDVLKGQDGISYYDVYEWSGSLPMMEPGVGYMIKSESSTVRTFRYPGATVSLAPMRSPAKVAAGNSSSVFNVVDYRNYSGNAIMSAKVMNGNAPMANVEVGVFADGECRAVAVTNENGIAYLTIPGDEAAVLNFRIAKGADISDANETLLYETDAVFGTPMNPFVLSIGGTTGINVSAADETAGSAYDLQGRKIESSTGNGIMIIDGKKQLVK